MPLTATAQEYRRTTYQCAMRAVHQILVERGYGRVCGLVVVIAVLRCHPPLRSANKNHGEDQKSSEPHSTVHLFLHLCLHCVSGAGVPSDHLPTGTMNMV